MKIFLEGEEGNSRALCAPHESERRRPSFIHRKSENQNLLSSLS
jgi:hypothetical protein